MVDAGAPLPREETHAIPDWLKPITMETPVEAPIISPALEETPESSQEKISQEESHIVIGDIVSSLEESAELMPLTEAISDPIIISSEESANDIALVDPLNTPMLTEEEATISSFDPLTQIDSINPIDTPENTLNQTPTSESLDSDDDGEDMIPDWLKPLDTSAHEEETHIDVIEDDESLDTYKPPIIIPPPPDTDLPEWLKSSIENKESSPSEKPKKQKTPQKTREAPKSVPKKKADPKPKKTPLSQNSGSSDDIPDWLK